MTEEQIKICNEVNEKMKEILKLTIEGDKIAAPIRELSDDKIIEECDKYLSSLSDDEFKENWRKYFG